MLIFSQAAELCLCFCILQCLDFLLAIGVNGTTLYLGLISEIDIANWYVLLVNQSFSLLSSQLSPVFVDPLPLKFYIESKNDFLTDEEIRIIDLLPSIDIHYSWDTSANFLILHHMRLPFGIYSLYCWRTKWMVGLWWSCSFLHWLVISFYC